MSLVSLDAPNHRISLSLAGLFNRAILMSGSALSPWSMYSGDPIAFAASVDCHTDVIDCLRSKATEELIHSHVFGPIVDGLVIPGDPLTVMSTGNYTSTVYAGMKASSGGHSLMFGVTRVEAPLELSPEEEKQGISLDKRDTILRTLVRSMVNYYQELISLALINEYTDWSVPSEHPINVLDSLIDILGDASIVAPITKVANLHFKHIQKPIYQYVFVYQVRIILFLGKRGGGYDRGATHSSTSDGQGISEPWRESVS